MKKFLKGLFIAIVGIFVVIWTIYHPIQYVCGKQRLYSFIEEQGTNKDNILKLSSGFDYSTGNYQYYVIFKDDPLVEYTYDYSLIMLFSTDFKYVLSHTNEMSFSAKEYSTGTTLGNTYFKKVKYMDHMYEWR